MTDSCANLHAARIIAGLSFRELAEAVGVSPSYLHDLENGRRTPSKRVADELNRVLGEGAVVLPPTVEDLRGLLREAVEAVEATEGTTGCIPTRALPVRNWLRRARATLGEAPDRREKDTEDTMKR